MTCAPRDDRPPSNLPCVGQFVQHTGEFAGAVGLCQKPPALRQILFPDIHKARGRDDLDRRPAAADGAGKLQPVHRTRHLDIGEDDVNIGSGFEDRYSLVAIACLDDFKPGILNHLGRIHPQQEFVFDN